MGVLGRLEGEHVSLEAEHMSLEAEDEWSFQMIKDPCPPYQEWFMAASDSDFGID